MSDEEFTVFCRNLADEVTESILYELFLQAGPVEDVRIPTQDGKNRSYGFVVFKHKCSVRYALDLFKDTKLYGKYIALQNRALDAEREAEMRNRYINRMNGGIDALRGGPQMNRVNEMNALRGGSLKHFSMHDDMNPLRGGTMGFSRMDNMAPRGFSDSHYRQSSTSDECSLNFDPRLTNPYGSSLGSFFPQSDTRGSQPYDLSPTTFDRYGKNDLRNVLNNVRHVDDLNLNDQDSRNKNLDRNYSRQRDYPREYSRQSQDHLRRDRNHRSERNYDRSESKHRQRSRSRDRSSHRNSYRHSRR